MGPGEGIFKIRSTPLLNVLIFHSAPQDRLVEAGYEDISPLKRFFPYAFHAYPIKANGQRDFDDKWTISGFGEPHGPPMEVVREFMIVRGIDMLELKRIIQGTFYMFETAKDWPYKLTCSETGIVYPVDFCSTNPEVFKSGPKDKDRFFVTNGSSLASRCYHVSSFPNV